MDDVVGCEDSLMIDKTIPAYFFNLFGIVGGKRRCRDKTGKAQARLSGEKGRSLFFLNGLKSASTNGQNSLRLPGRRFGDC